MDSRGKRQTSVPWRSRCWPGVHGHDSAVQRADHSAGAAVLTDLSPPCRTRAAGTGAYAWPPSRCARARGTCSPRPDTAPGALGGRDTACCRPAACRHAAARPSAHPLPHARSGTPGCARPIVPSTCAPSRPLNRRWMLGTPVLRCPPGAGDLFEFPAPIKLGRRRHRCRVVFRLCILPPQTVQPGRLASADPGIVDVVQRAWHRQPPSPPDELRRVVLQDRPGLTFPERTSSKPAVRWWFLHRGTTACVLLGDDRAALRQSQRSWCHNAGTTKIRRF